MRTLILMTLAAGLCVAGQRGSSDRQFSKMDQNGDGKLTLEEFRAAGKKNADKAAKRFRKADADGDGFLTKAEFEAIKKKDRK